MREMAVLEKSRSLILALVFLCLPSTALAQGNSPKISDKELAAFAKAYVEVQQIRSQYEPSVRGARSAKERKRFQQEANTKLKKTLDRQGLTVGRYNTIYATVNASENLRRKTLRMVERERRKS